MCVAHLSLSFHYVTLSDIFFLFLRAKRLKYSSRFNGHTLPAQGKETSSEFGKSLSVTTITEAVVRYLELRLITTAGQYTYANTYTDRVASLLRLFPF